MRPNPPTEPPSWATAQPGSTLQMIPAFLDITLDDVLNVNTFGIITLGEWKCPPGTVGITLSHINNRPTMLFGRVYAEPAAGVHDWFVKCAQLSSPVHFGIEFCGDMADGLNVIVKSGIPCRFFGRLERDEAQRLAAILPTLKPATK
jgi:hypothetical protein